jgi:hypothetical protein
MSTPATMLLGWARVATMISGLWLLRRIRHDAGWLDVGWADGNEW